MVTRELNFYQEFLLEKKQSDVREERNSKIWRIIVIKAYRLFHVSTDASTSKFELYALLHRAQTFANILDEMCKMPHSFNSCDRRELYVIFHNDRERERHHF